MPGTDDAYARAAADRQGRAGEDPQQRAGDSRPVSSGTEDRLQHALELAYRYLDRRERTVDEVRHHFERRGVDSAAADAAIQFLLDERYLDDARYARLFAEDKRRLDQWGADRIRRTLVERGIDRELADEVVTGDGSESELDRAVALLRRRFSSPPQERRERDKALGVLLRKGYESELALDALAAYTRDAGEPGFR